MNQSHTMPIRLSAAGSRRSMLATGGILALAGFFAAPHGQAVLAASGLVLAQGFGHGTLFPTQGDADAAPYTAILWDAASRGIFYAAKDGVAGIAPSDALVAALAAGERPHAAVVAPESGGTGAHQVWAMRLVYAGLGADPGAMTYQGEPLEEAEAAAWLGVTPLALPGGPRDLAGGYLLIAGLPALDLPEGEGVRLSS